MPAVVCTKCSVATNLKTDQTEATLAATFCRACETRGTLVPALFDVDAKTWRARTETDPPDLTEIEIDGKPISLWEIAVLQETMQRCRTQPGQWLTYDEIFDLRTRSGKSQQLTLCSLIAVGALQKVNLQVQQCTSGPTLIRCPAAKTARTPPCS